TCGRHVRTQPGRRLGRRDRDVERIGAGAAATDRPLVSDGTHDGNRRDGCVLGESLLLLTPRRRFGGNRTDRLQRCEGTEAVGALLLGKPLDDGPTSYPTIRF